MGFFKTLFTGKEETAEEKLEQKKDNQFDTLKYDGVQAMQTGNTNFAIACFEHALKLREDTETRKFYANALLRKADFEGAIEQMEHVIEAEPKDIEMQMSIAELYFQNENYEKMENTCNTIISLDPANGVPHYIMAKMHKAKADFINAIVQSTQAIAKNDDYNEAYYLRAQVLFEMQQYNEAETDIDKVLTNDEENEEFIMMKAICCEALQKDEEAKERYRKVIDMNPFITQAYIHLGGILMKEGNKEEAARIVEEGLQLAPEELQNFTGEFTNLEEKMKESYSAINPYQLGISL